MADRERHVFSDKSADRMPKVARTMNNWLQAFSVLGCVMGQRHPERCLFFWTRYTKSHGGSAWWKYNKDFRRRLSLQPDNGWGGEGYRCLDLTDDGAEWPPSPVLPPREQWPFAAWEHAGYTLMAAVNFLACANTSTSALPVAALTEQPDATACLDLPLSPSGLPMGRTPVTAAWMSLWLDIFNNP